MIISIEDHLNWDLSNSRKTRMKYNTSVGGKNCQANYKMLNKKFSDKFQINMSLNQLNQMTTCVIQIDVTLAY